MDLEGNYIPPIKLREAIVQDNSHDIYCFQCHHEGDVLRCDSCPRVYHPRCIGLSLSSDADWTCPECEVAQSSFNLINQSIPSRRYSQEEFHIMLKYALDRLKSQPQALHFRHSIDKQQMSEYLKYIIHPMNLETIERNINSKKYTSIKAFIGDMKWILHNSIIYNGNQSKLTSNARTLLKISRHEMTEIDICSECYLRSVQFMRTDWFTIPCAIPHTLCWAKMKTYQPWPAKILRIVNNEVDVRFFGEHNRARVPMKNCFVLSKEYPRSIKRKGSVTFEKSLVELQNHVDRLNRLYGHFTYAPPQTLLSKTKPFKFVSIIDDSSLPSYMMVSNHTSRMKHSKQRRFPSPQPFSEFSTKKATKRDHHQSSHERQQPSKRRRIANENSILREDNESQSTLNVFDIFNQSDHMFLPIKDDRRISSCRPSSPTDNKLQIQALLRRYIRCKSPTINFITRDVTATMNALLDDVEAILDVQTDTTLSPESNQISEQSIHSRKFRKSNLHHRMTHEDSISKFLRNSSSPILPLRSLSIISPRVDIFESLFSVTNNAAARQQLEKGPSIELHDVKVELIDNEDDQVMQRSLSTNFPFTSLPINIDVPLPTIIPKSTIIPQQNIYSSLSSNDASVCRRREPTWGYEESTIQTPTSSNVSLETFLLSVNSIPIPNQHAKRIPQSTTEVAPDSGQPNSEIQMILNAFNNQFQQLLLNLSNQLESSLQTTRLQYENNLDELHRTYLLSLNDLHSVATEQMQEIQQSFQVQYWERLSEMRDRYESKLRYQSFL